MANIVKIHTCTDQIRTLPHISDLAARVRHSAAAARYLDVEHTADVLGRSPQVGVVVIQER